jgi:NADH-quinone oxidoreductase subunit N
MLSLIGIPPTIGFITKLFLFSSGVSSGYSWLIIFALINSVISAYYYFIFGQRGQPILG